MREINVEKVKQLARHQLSEMAQERMDILATDMPPKVRGSMERLFAVANTLSEVVNDCFDINHPLSVEVAGIVSSVVSGITKGQVVEEVERFFAIKQSIIKNNTAESLH